VSLGQQESLGSPATGKFREAIEVEGIIRNTRMIDSQKVFNLTHKILFIFPPYAYAKAYRKKAPAGYRNPWRLSFRYLLDMSGHGFLQ
jgi:hypothetical protein